MPEDKNPFGDSAGTEVGVEVWRIEKLSPAAVPRAQHGKFHSGDAYIVLQTLKKFSSLEWYIYFWLGSESSVDEQGAAALFAVELDDRLGGGPVQCREVQGAESDRFMQVFPAVHYLEGGVDSGFKHVERGVYEKRLLHLKGARSVRVTTVPLSSSSLNSGDVFLLDLGMTLYMWSGKEANKKEKAKGLDVAISIKDSERGGKARVLPIAQGSEPAEFWEAIGGQGPIAAAIDDAPVGGSDASAVGGVTKLFRVSDASGELLTTEVASEKLARSMLDSDDVFIMDNGSEIFVWVGKGATAQERKGGMASGSAYCTQAGRPKETRVTKVMEGTEPATFKANFESWEQWTMPTEQVSSMRRHGSSMSEIMSPGRIATRRESKSVDELATDMVDSPRAVELNRRSTRAAMLDQGEGTVEVFRIESFSKVTVEEALHGQFYAGDSYVVHYSYEKGSKLFHMLYFWLGLGSSIDEKGAAALLTKQMDDELGGQATQVRVVMGKEPLHFIKIWKGKMVIHSGGKASGFKNREDVDSYDTDGISLFHVRGNDEFDTRAVQVAEVASSLNSGDCFVLLTPSVMYVWKGDGANETEMETAVNIGELLKEARPLEQVVEGKEPAPFWDALGGKAEYPSARELPESSREPMLFCCSNSTGVFKLEPIFDFGQVDLDDDDVFILDSFTTIWVWVGSASNREESAMAMQAAEAYIKQQKYDALTPIVSVKSGAEPAIFTCHFLGWDASLNQAFTDPYAAKLRAIAASEAGDAAGEGTPDRRLSSAIAGLRKTPSTEEQRQGSVGDVPRRMTPATVGRQDSFERARLRKTPSSLEKQSEEKPAHIQRQESFDRSRLRKTPTSEAVKATTTEPTPEAKAVMLQRQQSFDRNRLRKTPSSVAKEVVVTTPTATATSTDAAAEEASEAERLIAAARQRLRKSTSGTSPTASSADKPASPYDEIRRSLTRTPNGSNLGGPGFLDCLVPCLAKTASAPAPEAIVANNAALQMKQPLLDISDPGAATAAVTKPATPKTPEVSVPPLAISGKRFSLEALKSPTGQLPAGVDPAKREQWLNDDEFEAALGSPREKFNELKPWKQAELRKKSGLW